MIAIVLIGSATLFYAGYILFSFKLLRFNSPNTETKGYKTFSVVIAAKNEETNIPGLLNSLLELEYPKQFYEIIIVNDNSTDNTLTILDKYIPKLGNLRVITPKNKKYEGKKGAIEQGILEAKNEYIVTSDADVQINSQWLSTYNASYGDNDCLLGNVVFSKNNTLVNLLSRFENLKNSGLIYTSVLFGFPYSARAANFSYKKEVFTALNGYKNISQILSGDDDLFLQQIVKHKYNVGLNLAPKSTIITQSVSTFKDYLRQKARHVSASNHYNKKAQILLAIWHLFNLIFAFSFLLSPVDINFIFPTLLKIITDILILTNLGRKLNSKITILECLCADILYEFLVIVNYINATFGKIIWK